MSASQGFRGGGKLRALGMAAAVVLMATAAAGGATLRVPADYATIQAAIDAAQPGDTVLVADGTYRGPGNRDIDFLGKAITVQSEHGAATCIIDCQGSEADAHRGWYFHSGETAASILAGFTVRNGWAPGSLDATGGGIYCEDASPTIRNCVVTRCNVPYG